MIYNREINGVKFTLVCESWSTRNSWGHEVTLYKNDFAKIGRAKIRYYNRTWECYQYQSAIHCVISQAINEIKEAAKAVMVEQKLDAVMDVRGVFVGGVDISDSVILKLKGAKK